METALGWKLVGSNGPSIYFIQTDGDFGRFLDVRSRYVSEEINIASSITKAIGRITFLDDPGGQELARLLATVEEVREMSPSALEAWEAHKRRYHESLREAGVAELHYRPSAEPTLSQD